MKMILGFKLDYPDAGSVRFLHDFKARCDQPFNVVSMPFLKKRLAHVHSNVWALQLAFAWPPLQIYGLFWLGICWAFGWPWPAYLVAVPFLVLWLVDFPAFWLFFLRLGLRKAGYKGRVLRVAQPVMLEALLWDK